jgi:hypothetical protein
VPLRQMPSRRERNNRNQRRPGVLTTTTTLSNTIHYTVDVDTANVRNQAAVVTFDSIAIGSIVERQPSAL